MATIWSSTLPMSTTTAGLRGSGFGAATLREGRAGFPMMPGVAVGEADHLHVMPGGAIERGRAARSVVRVVGMGADDQQAEGTIGHEDSLCVGSFVCVAAGFS